MVSVVSILKVFVSRKRLTLLRSKIDRHFLLGSFLALKKFQDLYLNHIVVIATDNTTVDVYKQGGGVGGNLVWSSIWPIVENPDLSIQDTGDSQNPTHSRPSKCHNRQPIQARPDHPDRMVPPSRGLPGNMLPMVAAISGPICH